MPSRPSVLLAHQKSQLQHDSALISGGEATLLTPATTLRQHIDPEVLPRPDYFESLSELHTWYEFRFGDAAHDHLELCGRHKGPPQHGHTVHGLAPGLQPALLPHNRETRCPKLAVCHDFQGGYNERPDARGYSFEHFHLVDTFIYFSHKRVTIPPVSWLHAARRAGTKVLGTLIFEWKESVPDLSQLLRGPTRKSIGLRGPTTFSPQYAIELIELALDRGCSGFLVNVEVSLDLGFACSGELWPAWVGEQARSNEMSKNAERLRAWVCFLRDEGRKRFSEAGKPADEWEVMWYDSVIYPQGHLAWQDALTPNNVDFFRSADSFFTNYTWARPPQPLPPGKFVILNDSDPQALQLQGYGLTGPDDGGFHPALLLSAAMADSLDSHSRVSVYIGIDVFGRNCWGGMQTWKSLNMIGPHRRTRPGNADTLKVDLADAGEALEMSVALFAPGWTWEHEEPEASGRSWKQWWQEDCDFWLGTSRGLCDTIPVQSFFSHAISDDVRLARRSETRRRGFYTNFALGSGTSWYVLGDEVCNWVDLPSASDAKLAGWTDIGAWMPKPDLLFATLNQQIDAGETGGIARWWLDEQTVFDGNVALGLELVADVNDQDIPLCSFPVSYNSSQGCDWTFHVAFKLGSMANVEVTPLVSCNTGKLTCKKVKFESKPISHGWQIGSLKVKLLEATETDRPTVFSLGVKFSEVKARTSAWIGALAFAPESSHAHSNVKPMTAIPGPVQYTPRGNPLVEVVLEWPAFDQVSPYFNVWIQLPDDALSRTWLGTSTREATTNEFCILGLDTASIFPGCTELQVVATPLGFADMGYAVATIVV